MDYKWEKIAAMDCAILAATVYAVTDNVFPYNALSGVVGVVGVVVATNWALDHFAGEEG